MNMKREKVKKNLIILFSLVLVFAVILVLFSQGVIWFNNPSLKQYPVRGVDVSAHQGKIDWQAIAAQDIYFAFIKATEGSSFIDDQFQDNWENARSAGIIVGAFLVMRARAKVKQKILLIQYLMKNMLCRPLWILSFTAHLKNSLWNRRRPDLFWMSCWKLYMNIIMLNL